MQNKNELSQIHSMYREMPAIRLPVGKFLALFLFCFVCLLVACLAGYGNIEWYSLPSDLYNSWLGHSATLTVTLFELRLHRALAAFLTGGSLALAGVMMQALLRNPLADPYVLGVSGGASVGALLMLLLVGIAWIVNLAAFAGAVGIAMLLYILARRELGRYAPVDASDKLLLTGVILAFGCGALVTLMLSIAPDHDLRGMVFWLVGDLDGASLNWLSFLVLLVVLIISLMLARSVNLLSLHAEEASTLGVNVGLIRKTLFTCSALLTACAVTNAGCIGFVGLIIPHACRMVFGADHRFLLLSAALAGGGFLVLADTIARTALSPHQLPVGAVTALIGVPVFLLQLYQHRQR